LLLLPMLVLLEGVGHLCALRGRPWPLRLTDSVLPVRVCVLKEDHVAVLFAGGAAFFNDVAQRGRRLEEP
jgi:hypothetical protein